MPTFADAEAAIAARDYRAALSILEALDVVGEDACYRRDIQAAACADRLGLFPLCEESATRAHSYGDDMADPFALVARAQRRQGLIADAAATASSGARIHPTNLAIARELALALVALGRYKEARGPPTLPPTPTKRTSSCSWPTGTSGNPSTPTPRSGLSILPRKSTSTTMTRESPSTPWLTPQGRGTLLLPDRNPAPVAAAYRTMLRRVRTVLTNAWKGAAIAALCCGLFYLFVARGVFPGVRWGVFLLYVASIVSVYFYVGHQIAAFNRTLPRGVCLTFMRLCTRFTERGGRIFLFRRISLISGFFLIAFMNGIG